MVHFPPGDWASFTLNTIVSGPVEEKWVAPLGTPILFGRVGALLPMLAADVDTLTDATAPAVVRAADRPTLEARGWPRGPASATFDDGSQIAIDDTSQGVSVTFLPGAFGQAIVCTLDLKSRQGKTSQLTHVFSGATELPSVTSEADVRASSGSTYFLDGDSIVLRLAGAQTAWIE